MAKTPKWIYSSVPRARSWVEKIFIGGRQQGKTEQTRQQVKKAIEDGKQVVVSDAPPVNGQFIPPAKE